MARSVAAAARDRQAHDPGAAARTVPAAALWDAQAVSGPAHRDPPAATGAADDPPPAAAARYQAAIRGTVNGVSAASSVTATPTIVSVSMTQGG